MSNPPTSPLAEKAAALRDSVLATPAPRWLPDAAYALILALLARIFARLEDMIALWAQGILAPPPAREPRAPVARPRRTPARARRTPRRSSPRPRPAPELRPRPLRIRIWWSASRGTRRGFTLPAPRPRAKRDPPTAHRA
jgi:hypothetical protein